MENVKKKSFIMYSDFEGSLHCLSMRERGLLITMIFSYVNRGETGDAEPSARVKLAFSLIKSQLDRDLEKYEEKCKKNTENAKRRWNSKSEKSMRSHAIACDSDNDNENENENESESDNVIVIDNENESDNDNERTGADFAEGEKEGTPCQKNKKEKNKYKKGKGNYANNYSKSDDSFHSFDADDFFEAALRRSYSDLPFLEESSFS